MFGRLLGWYTVYICIYIFGALAPNEICQLQNSLYIQVLRSPILPALLHGTEAVAISQTFHHGTWNRITQLLQRAPLIFGWAAITLGIGPHSGYCYFRTFMCELHMCLVHPHNDSIYYMIG